MQVADKRMNERREHHDSPDPYCLLRLPISNSKIKSTEYWNSTSELELERREKCSSMEILVL